MCTISAVCRISFLARVPTTSISTRRFLALAFGLVLVVSHRLLLALAFGVHAVASRCPCRDQVGLHGFGAAHGQASGCSCRSPHVAVGVADGDDHFEVDALDILETRSSSLARPSGFSTDLFEVEEGVGGVRHLLAGRSSRRCWGSRGLRGGRRSRSRARGPAAGGGAGAGGRGESGSRAAAAFWTRAPSQPTAWRLAGVQLASRQQMFVGAVASTRIRRCRRRVLTQLSTLRAAVGKQRRGHRWQEQSSTSFRSRPAWRRAMPPCSVSSWFSSRGKSRSDVCINVRTCDSECAGKPPQLPGADHRQRIVP